MTSRREIGTKPKKPPCTKCGGTSYRDHRFGLGDCCAFKKKRAADKRKRKLRKNSKTA